MEAQALVHRAQCGDREAFGELYERFSPRLYGYLYCHLNGQVHLAEDLTEEVFVKMLEKLDGYTDRGLPFTAWMFKIAHNHLVDYIRSQPKTGLISIQQCGDLPERYAERTLDLALTHTELTRSLSDLTDVQRRVVALRFLQGLSVSETASALGKTEDGIKKLQARGLQAMKKSLSAPRQRLAVA